MKHLLFILTFIINGHAFAQSTEVTYAFKAKGEKKIMKLFYNDSSTLFVYNKEGSDTTYDAYKGVEYNDSFGMIVKVSRYDSIGQMVYRNFNSKTIKLRQTKVGPLDAFTVDDYWKEIDWKIQNKHKTIAGYNCRKATGFFRGRKYTAWFTTEIAKPYGPWKLFGLPGLIVAAQDNDGVFDVEMIQIKPGADSSRIAIPSASENKTMKAYVYYLDHSAELTLDKIKSKTLPKGISIGKPIYTTPVKEIRNADFEKEYEWEQDKSAVPEVIINNKKD